MKSISFTLISLCLILPTACERDVKNVTLPDFKQKLVITSFLSPFDSISFVSVGSNQKIYGDLSGTAVPENLTATISNGVKQINLERADDGFIFRPEDMPVEGGKTYKLKVTDGRGLTAEATCTIPFARNLNLEADTLREYYEYSGDPDWYLIRANIHITDPPGEVNYFRFSSKEVYIISDFQFKFVEQIYPEKQAFFCDEGKDGERIFANSVLTQKPTDCDAAFLIFYVLNTDEDYYRYHQSLDNYSGGDDPFTEISPVYSNITGGLGIFASYNVDSLVFRLK